MCGCYQHNLGFVWFNSQKKIPLIRQQECCPARSAPGPTRMSLVVSGGVLGPLSRPAVDWRCCRGHHPLVPSWQTSHLGTRFQHLHLCGAPTCACGGPHGTPDEQSPSRGISGGASAPPTRCWEARGGVCLGSAGCGVLDLPFQGCPWVQAPGHRAAVTLSCPWGTVPGCWCLSEISSMDEDGPGTWAVMAACQHPDSLRKGTPAVCLPQACCPAGALRGATCALRGKAARMVLQTKGGAGNAPFQAILCRFHRENDFSKTFDW